MTLKNNIIILSSEFPPLPGGIGNHAFHLASMLQQKGYQVYVLTDHRGTDTVQQEIKFDSRQPFKILRVRRYNFVLITYLSRIINAIKLISKQKSGIVICTGRFQLWLGAAISVFFRGRKFMAVVHGSELVQNHLVTRWSLNRFGQVVAVSRFTASLAANMMNENRITVINNGFLPLMKANDKVKELSGNPSLITVGNVSKRKGQHNVIQALPKIREIFPDAQYHIVGIPTEREAFTKLASTLNVSDAVHFHGAVSTERLAQLVAGADIFLMLSERLNNGDVEGFGIAILEANDLGLPAIGSNDSGIADAIKEGFSGRLVNPKDTDAIALALKEIMDNYEIYSNQAKSWAEGFRWDKVIDQYFDVLNDKLDKKTV